MPLNQILRFPIFLPVLFWSASAMNSSAVINQVRFSLPEWKTTISVPERDELLHLTRPIETL
jgi:hypothetical protein